MAHYDVVVAGGGTMGTAVAWELGKRGLKALVLEQFQHIHPFGAHSGETRIIRHAYAEGADYVPLVLRADSHWTDLEAATAERVLHRVGAIELSAPGHGRVQAARDSADAHGLPYEVLPIDEFRRRYHQFRAGDDWQAGFEPDGGFIDVTRSLGALAAEVRKSGVEIREHAPVTGWSASGDGVRVETASSVETADRLIITAGAWADQLLRDLGLPIQIVRKTLFWLEVEEPELFAPDRCPVYIAGIPGYQFYGFPSWGRPGEKVAIHSGGLETDPDQVDREIARWERDEIVTVARTVLLGLTGKVLDATTCLYSSTPDEDFVIDLVPANPNVVFAAGFSGHGYKFAPAIGELLVAMVLGERETLPRFRMDRFQGASM
jgi:monomeric sarcosine oxidase